MARAILCMTLAMASGCLSGDAVLEQPCTEDADCWSKQHCAQTDAERTLGLPGMCLPEDVDCHEDEQLGCACQPSETGRTCQATFRPLPDGYPQMHCDPALLVCLPAGPDDGGSDDNGSDDNGSDDNGSEGTEQ